MARGEDTGNHPGRRPPPPPPRNQPAASSGRTPPPRPTGPAKKRSGPENDAAIARQNEANRRHHVEPTQVHSLRQNTAPGRSDARVEQSRELGAKLSGHISAGRHQGDNPDKSLSYWRNNDKGYRKP